MLVAARVSGVQSLQAFQSEDGFVEKGEFLVPYLGTGYSGNRDPAVMTFSW